MLTIRKQNLRLLTTKEEKIFTKSCVLQWTYEVFVMHEVKATSLQRYPDNCPREKLSPVKVRVWVRVSFRIKGKFFSEIIDLEPL